MSIVNININIKKIKKLLLELIKMGLIIDSIRSNEFSSDGKAKRSYL